MRVLICALCLLPSLLQAADINQPQLISCVSDESALKGSFQKNKTQKASGEVRERFSEFLFAENFSVYKSKLDFNWDPGPGGPASIEIRTSEKNHHQVKIQSLRKSSLIVVSNASDPFFNLESWSFAFNFRIESLIATRVQTNAAALKAEVLTYDCTFKPV